MRRDNFDDSGFELDPSKADKTGLKSGEIFFSYQVTICLTLKEHLLSADFVTISNTRNDLGFYNCTLISHGARCILNLCSQVLNFTLTATFDLIVQQFPRCSLLAGKLLILLKRDNGVREQLRSTLRQLLVIGNLQICSKQPEFEL